MVQESGISEGRAILKVRGGKLIKVRVRFTPERIEEVHFTGDFFIHPEESLEVLEKSLSGTTRKKTSEIIREFSETVEMIGVSPEDFIDALKLAMEKKIE